MTTFNQADIKFRDLCQDIVELVEDDGGIEAVDELLRENFDVIFTLVNAEEALADAMIHSEDYSPDA